MMAIIMCLWKCWTRENEMDSRASLGRLSGSLRISPTGYLHCVRRVVSELLEGEGGGGGRTQFCGTLCVSLGIVRGWMRRGRKEKCGGEGKGGRTGLNTMLRNYRQNL